MSNRFENSEEAQAWSTFFAAQCPKLMSAKPANIDKEVQAAAASADEMLHAWRERAYPPRESEEEPAKSE